MKNRIKEGSSMIGVYGRSDGSSSILSFNGSESRESIDETKQGKCSFTVFFDVLSSLLQHNGCFGDVLFVFSLFLTITWLLGHQSLVEWLNETLPYLNLPWEASEEELRACLVDGTVLCNLLNQLSPGSMRMGGSFEPGCVNIERFLAAMDEMALPRFEVSDLEQGDMIPVIQSLKALKASFSDDGYDKNKLCARRRWSLPADHSKGVDNNFNDGGSQFKEASEINTSHAQILDLLKSNSLQNTSTRSLFDMLDRLLDESPQKMNHVFVSILRGIVQVVEQRISNQAENIKNQNILFRVREEKYRSRINVLETLASGTTDENELRSEEKDVLQIEKEKEHSDAELSKLKQELQIVKVTHEKQILELKLKSEKTKVELEKQLKESELRVVEAKELEKLCETKTKRWEKKEQTYKRFINHQTEALQELKATSVSLKHDVLKIRENYFKDLNYYGIKLRGVAHAAKNYQIIIEENRRLYNEVQELKGNIRVYCRIRPFLQGQDKKQTSIEYTGENGELVVANPLKQGKDTYRLFKFNKVFGPASTQEEVFLDTRPLIRSILDGYNVCIFAYGQTGSGKTYTMSGPSITSEEDWGVNYRALNDLFHLTQSRQNSVIYEVGVQMVEIYNEQVRDLLSEDGPNKRLGIWNTALPNGLAVPDASMHSVKSTEDVLELMNIGLMNRTVGATTLNEKSSRSHSVVSVHVRGVDVKTESVLRGSLHLVDLAGSERVGRSEVTGERLKETQYINKSLSALGDVIFALAHKNPHVPYRNSKLTQVLQNSLGGQAKTLMFVQINPDEDSYAETVSTLKFAERVSGVELGAARSYKEGRDVRQLMEQVSNLKDMIAKKDEVLQKFQNINVIQKRGLSKLRIVSPPRRHSLGGALTNSPRRRQGSGLLGRTTSDSTDEHRHQNESRSSSKFTETDGSISSGAMELTLFPETSNPPEMFEQNNKANVGTSKPLKHTPKADKTRPSRLSISNTSAKALTSSKRPITGFSSSVKPLNSKR
ncbi:Calponin homology domain [Arabidopsis thaliana x Arabidopsis arenosa]|uniref:Calponin homology domain n=1 Tax=Arabidopsis thaliana x Arabidopsis arenosa TaxID=1240361 RepID=A0A8T1YDS6_9BRAS|nr:Calponin homology domain [Arabidopsis thaliana x Arabidopsis arenosa]